MLRSMYSGISGMKVNQVKLDVIGNNISNVGTTAFKSSRARFSDMLRQNVTDAMAPGSNVGGTNASQVGLGVQLASIDTVMTQGMMQPTGRNLDVAIDGDGFFMVSKGPTVFGNELNVSHAPGTHTLNQTGSGSSDIMYSRDGSFMLDREGNLLTGDGFRVMGYSVTNDDNSMPPTSKSPLPVSAAGVDIRFGPGSQLNDFKVVLGNIGPGTVTSLDVNKENKTLVLNGDFSAEGTLTKEQIQLAMNKGLAAAGISQEVTVSGNPIKVSELSTEAISGGTNNEAPGTVTLGGVTIKLDPGSTLNGYKFKVEHNASLKKPEASINETEKEIVISRNLLDTDAIKGDDLAKIVNKALKDAKIDQKVTMTGSMSVIKGLQGKLEGGSKEKPATIKPIDPKNEMPLKIDIGGTSDFNNYKISFAVADNITDDVEISANSTEIKIKFKKDSSPTDTQIKNALESALKSKYDEDKIKITIDTSKLDTSVVKEFSASRVSDGAEAKAPKKVTVSGLGFEFPAGEDFNDLEIVVGDIQADPTKVEVQKDASGKANKIILNANFLEGMISSTEIKDALDAGFTAAGITPIPDVSVSGTGKFDNSGLNSETIEGGTDLTSPGNVSVFGMDITLGAGASLNNYKIQIGTVTEGTKTEALVDPKNKTIIINADFVNAGKVSSKDIENAINKSLKNAGIDQSVSVGGQPSSVDNAKSDDILGGTPVQSLNENGVLNFVNGGGDIKAYDGELKTLKIPDKVRVPGPTPGEDKELRVKTYSIDKNGIITGVLEDGRVAALGQIAMASFKNPEGLTSMGGNIYTGSVNSGEAVIKSGIGTTGEDNSKGYGDNLQGMLEMSNVDLAEQFTDMIVTTRAFQASGKMITTGDEVLQDIINLKR